jgi:glycosyltransferase involved in cell wall biosynthesis
MAEDLGREVGIRENQIAVLPNPVDVDAIRAAASSGPSQWSGPGPHLLAVGRLSREKGFDLLLRALARVRERFAHADLVIVGSGPEEMDLKALRHELSIENAVQFAGQVDSPHAYFPGASLYVLSSRHEGLPNSLLEAAAGGLPIVALPASLGIVDLLRREPGAWLAPEISADALAASLLTALQALRPGERFAHPFVEEFRLERAIQGYEDLIDALIEDPA